MSHLSFFVNDRPVSLAIDPATPLLDVLREELGLNRERVRFITAPMGGSSGGRQDPSPAVSGRKLTLTRDPISYPAGHLGVARGRP